jgi:hypothetical protein
MMSERALRQAALRIRQIYVPLLVNHDWGRRVGVLLSARVEPTEDDEFVLLAVAGLFENEDEPERYPIGARNILWQHYDEILDDESLQESILEANHDESSIDQMSALSVEGIAVRLAVYLDYAYSRRKRGGYMMKFLVAQVDDLKINVYRDHPPPHFHVTSRQRNLNVRFDLETLEPLDGERIERADQKKIRRFFENNPGALQRLRDEHRRMQA